jgi:leucyl/phenylalanyl-tRNA--protein transferase
VSDDTFTARDLIACYRMGVFPMGEARDDPNFYLVDPKLRGVIDPARFHLSRRLARTVRSDPFEVRVDTVFGEVVRACAERDETWINAPIEELYGELHAMGLAHSVECWKDGLLVGGLYGVCLDGGFFGESMFSRARDASKVALVHLIARLRAGGFALLDCQFLTDHLGQFGTEEIPRAEYKRRLAAAMETRGDFFALPAQASGAQALQAISQAS